MIERAFRARLLADATVAALVADRVYYGALPQRPTYPLVELLKVDKTSGLTLSDAVGPNTVRVQVDCWAEDVDAVRGLAAAVNGSDGQTARGPLHGWGGTSEGERIRLVELLVERSTEYEPDKTPGRMLYRVSADYRAYL